MAVEYPNVRFVGVDYALQTDAQGNVIPPPPNWAALKFREKQGSFLVSALAALVSKSKKLGFVGGMDFPLIHKFEAGYKDDFATASLEGIAVYRGASELRTELLATGNQCGALLLWTSVGEAF